MGKHHCSSQPAPARSVSGVGGVPSRLAGQMADASIQFDVRENQQLAARQVQSRRG